MQTKKPPRLVRLAQLVGRPRAVPPVQGILPWNPSTLWRKVKAGEFPQPVKLGPNSTAWVLDEVEAWLRERMEARS